MAAKYSPEERRKRKSACAHAQMTAFWAGCTGEARAKRCEQITNPEAQAKSHAAQRTPEFAARRSAWSKAMWADVSPEKRLEVGRFLQEAQRKAREERLAQGLPARPKLSPEALAVLRQNMLNFWAKREHIRKAAAEKRAAKEAARKAREEKRAAKAALKKPKSCSRPRCVLTYRGETHLQVEWARILGINQTTISQRLAAGKSVEEALTKGRLPQAPRRKI